MLIILIVSVLINTTVFSATSYFSFSPEQKEKIKNGAKMGCMCLGGALVVGGASYGCYYLIAKIRRHQQETYQKEIDEKHDQLVFQEQQKKAYSKALQEKDFAKLNELIPQGILPNKSDLSRGGNMLHEIIAGWEPNAHQDIVRTMNHIGVVYQDKIQVYFEEIDAYPRERKPAEIIFDLAGKQDNSGLQLLAELYATLVNLGAKNIEQSQAAIVLKHVHADKYITFVNYAQKMGRVGKMGRVV